MKDWFGVKVTLRATHKGQPKTEDLYQEGIFLVKAKDQREAFQRAIECGKAQTSQYKNMYGQTVTWHLENVWDDPVLIEDEKFKDGTEVFYRFYHLKDGREAAPRDMPDRSFKQTLKQKRGRKI